MKQKNFLKALIFFCLVLFSTHFNAQSAGDIAFVGFNADGDRDFSIVVLADISASSTIYFTDDSTTGTGSPSSLTGSEGTLTWSTGSEVIQAGTIVNFTDVDSDGNANFGASIGTITRSGSFLLTTSSRDNIIAYTGTLGTPSTYIAGIQIGTISSGSYAIGPFDGDGITLTNTGLVIGTSLILADLSASPDGAVYNSSRIDQTTYAAYYAEINKNANWTSVVNGDGETLLPFSQEAFTINTRTWTGSTSTAWTLAGNWDSGVPDEDSNIIIPDVATNPTISTSVNTGNITINNGGELTVTGTVISKGLTTINSGGSLVASSGTFGGTVTYERSINFVSGNLKGWYLMSSPVSDQSFNDNYATANSLATSGSNRGFAAYNTSSNNWTYLLSDDSNVSSFTGNGRGFAVKKATETGTVSFTGTLNTDNSGVDVTLNTDSSRFNLLGNPYTAHINSATFLNNEASISSTKTIWVFNQTLGTDGQYEVKDVDDAFMIAPAQGFFVQANSGGGTFNFTESNQSHNSDTFQRNSAKPIVKLWITNDQIKNYARFKYLENATTGFDVGYEGELFSGISNSFAVYSELVTDNENKKYQSQSLPNSDYENMIIPIGLIADTGKEITFSAEIQNLPTELNVYLEDRFANTFTLLDDSNVFTFTSTETSKETGRFYLHTKSASALNTDDLTLAKIKIVSSRNNLSISGLTNGNSTLKIFNILGKQVVTNSFTSVNGTKNIVLPSLAKGIYIIQLTTEIGILNKKITIE